MTIREAMREPMSLQALVCLVIGIGIGIAFSLANVVMLGSLMSAHPRPNCTPAVEQAR